VYEASALLGIGIDWTRARIPDDVTVRQAYDRVRALLLADDTLESALRQTAAEGGEGSTDESVAEFREHIRLISIPEGMQFFVSGLDPLQAERQVQGWAQASLEQVALAAVHAIRAAEWQHSLYEASCRLEPGDSSTQETLWVCHSGSPAAAEAIPSSIRDEAEASRGILPVFTYSLLRKSEGTARALPWSRGNFVLGGALVGWMVGVFWVSFRTSRPV
jgi:hypothetical protein